VGGLGGDWADGGGKGGDPETRGGGTYHGRVYRVGGEGMSRRNWGGWWRGMGELGGAVDGGV
jgi:hypothetical protein